MNNNTFNNEILNTVSFKQMKKYANELMRGVKDNSSFTNMICNGIIGILTPWCGNCEIHGKFYATGDALNEYIRKAKSALGAWNYNCIIQIDSNKEYVIDNTTMGMMMLYEGK